MADTKLLDLPAATTLVGTEVVYGVQVATDVQITVEQILNPSNANMSLGNSNTLTFGSANGIIISRGASNILDIKSTATGPIGTYVRIYSNFTDASNYSRLSIGTNTGTGGFELVYERLGTGNSRPLNIVGDSANNINFGFSSASFKWQMQTSGRFVCPTDNANDIGDVGVTRPRSIYVGSNVNAGLAMGIGVVATTTSFLTITPGTTAKSQINFGSTGVAPTSPANGDLWFDGTDFKARVGGATRTFTLI